MPIDRTRLARGLRSWAMVNLVFGLALVCYWPALRGGPLWDDQAHITRTDLRPLSGLGRIWTDVHATQQYYPVLHSAFWIEHRLWGDATFGYHLLNVLLHATSACLLAMIVRRTLDDRRAHSSPAPFAVAWLSAIVFAVHPICVESVAWISEQKNTLSLLFYLLAAFAYLDFDRRRTPRGYALALILFLLALGTKTVTATLPAALLVVLWWRNGRLGWRRDVAPLVPWLVLGVAAGLFTAWDERTLMGAAGSAYALTAGQRALLAGRVIWFYLGKLVWPADLVFIYPRWDVAAAAGGWYGWAAGAVGVTAVLWLIRRRSRAPLAGWLFFVGTLFPALGFFNVFPFLYSYVADHFQYQASLGIFALAAGGAGWLLGRTPGPARAGVWVGCGAVVAILAARSHLESRTYRDSETLYRTTIARNPACWMAYNNLGADLTPVPGRAAEAQADLEEALRIRPDYPEAHNNLGALLAKLPGRGPDALRHYEEALRLKPDFSEAHDNLANLVAALPGRAPEALAHYQEALRLKPDNIDARYNLAGLLATLPGREADAMTEYRETIRRAPEYVQAYNNLAVLYVRQGRTADAERAWEQALRIDPNYADARTNLQRLRGSLGH